MKKIKAFKNKGYWFYQTKWMNDKDNITKSQGKKIRCIELNLEFPSQLPPQNIWDWEVL